jgi:RNA polymerase sigma factor (sigma-70 family)
MVRHLNDELKWNLSPDDQEMYCTQIGDYLTEPCSDHTLRTCIVSFHEDHALVELLRNPQHQAHNHAWTTWLSQIAAILQRAGLTWSSDPAVDRDDLIQIAQSELVRAIPTFQYHSRFSTWAYRVVVQRVQRAIRDSQAQKRASRPDSLDQLPEGSTPCYHEDYLDAYTAGQVLQERIEALLAAHPDARLAVIFRLWAVDDRSTEEIGRLIQLSPARTRALLAQARELLRDHPDIRQWNDPPES